MGFVEIETMGKKTLERFPVVKRAFKRVYQIASVITSREKVKSEGDLLRVTPMDGYEYFYGYYDKSPWDVTDRYMICVRVWKAYKSVAPKEAGTVCLIDTALNNRIIEVGTTHSWNVQQSCMAQWLGPDYKTRIIYNDFRNGAYCSIVYNVELMQEEKVLPLPIYDVSRDGTYALSLDFSRLHRLRPGYGYSNLPDRTKGILCPDECCIWKVDLEAGGVHELFTYMDFASFEPQSTMRGAEHKVNHIMISPNGKRFMVLHRWFDKGKKHTRLVTVNIDKTDMYNLSDDVFVSHCFWKNDNEILSFLRKNNTGDHYYLMQDRTQKYKMLWPELNTDGHCSYSPDHKYIITDTYPNRKRIASVYLCTEGDDRSRRIARVFSPFKYDNDCRCDLHPRWNRKGNLICIDSVHEGKRGLYVIDVSSMIHDLEKNKKNYKPSSNKLISFIIPAYNSSKTIEKCLNSLIGQTINKWEAIVINDGSSDQTLKIVEKYCKDPRVIVISQQNAGPGMARNNGIEHAQGDYISFLDSDDYLDSSFVEKVEERIKSTDADVVFYESYYEDESGAVDRTSKIYIHANKEKVDFITTQLSGTFSWGADKVIKKQLIRDANAKFLGHDVGEEALFTLQILLKANSIEFVKQPLYHYVQSANGQHKKGESDPLKNALHAVKTYMERNELLPQYQTALTNMAYKAVSMSMYRIALSKRYLFARKAMRKKLSEYSEEFDFNLIDKSKLNRTAQMLLPFVKLRMVTPIYCASKIRFNSGN